MSGPSPSLLRGRLCILAAALLWSLNGPFIKILTKPTALNLHEPPVPELLIAFYRVLFAALILAPSLRKADLSFRPLMLPMVLFFAAMNASFIWASGKGTAANAIFLQYTAPLWVYLAGVLWLKEPADRRTTLALAIAMTGVGVIVFDALRRPSAETLHVVLIGLVSGVTFAGVLVCLRLLRGASAQWLTVQNHVAAALVLVPVLWLTSPPTAAQVGFLAFFGIVQMGIPYWLMSRGMKTVSAQEAGTLSLLELLLNPLWTYLVSSELPDAPVLIGGGLILLALLWRYWPARANACDRSEDASH